MQVLYQLSYSPVLLPPGFPGGDANITRSPGWNTKSFPRGVKASEALRPASTTGLKQ